jgi:DnaJ-class molecular chaperone
MTSAFCSLLSVLCSPSNPPINLEPENASPMTAATTPAPTVRLCPLCRGTGSGLYNVMSDLSACEACNGTGEQSAVAVPPVVGLVPESPPCS